MKKILTLTAAMMLLASMAMAQSGVNLYVGDCSAGTAVHSATNACTSSTGTAFTAVGSVVLSMPDPDFIGAACILDLQTTQSALPDWWRGDATGCRGGAFAMLMDQTVTPSCATIWDQSTAAPTSVFAVMPFVNGPGRVRFNGGAAVLSSLVIPQDGAELGVFKLSISKAKTTGATVCAGCTYGACLVLNEINLQPMANGVAWQRYTNAIANNYITYQAGAPTCAGTTPTNNKSWGSIKAMYR
jgi:hypothetical protein